MNHELKPNLKWTFAGVLAAGLYGLIVLNDQRLPWLFAEGPSSASAQNLRQQVGIVGPVDAKDDRLPTGKGIPVGHAEGQFGDYLPNVQDPVFEGIELSPRSGDSKINGHTEFTSRVIYGKDGLAPGISDVHFYTSAHWLTGAVLKAGTSLPPDPDGRRVFTHSWIGGGRSNVAAILRRADYLVDQHDVVMTVGVNNGEDTRVPALLASAYNVIAVGLDTGKSSGGYTRADGPGRCKPDIVAPRGVTSFATPVVAAIAARLLETADRMSDAPYAGRSELIKAVLLAGAEKPDGWAPQDGKPLDEHLGAGRVRFDHSYSILSAGPAEPDQAATGDGWDFQSMPPNAVRATRLSVAHPAELSVVLVWNRRIDGRQVTDLISGQKRWLDTPRLADLDLRLVRVTGHGARDLVAESASLIDNVEHVHRATLVGGEYRLEVSRKDSFSEDWDYALAWRVTPRKQGDAGDSVVRGSTPRPAAADGVHDGPGQTTRAGAAGTPVDLAEQG